MITKYNNNYSSQDIDKLLYGLEGIYLTITKMVVIIGFSIVLNMTKELLLLLVAFNFLRYPAFGFHANKSITCLIFSLLVFIGIPAIFLKFGLSDHWMIIFTIISVLTLALFAPADTPKRPLTNVKKRRLRKVATILIAALYVIGIFTINNSTIRIILLLSLIIESIMVSPITYWLFGQTYNNYKKV